METSSRSPGTGSRYRFSLLRSTFCHVPGIGRESELSLWMQGCTDWTHFLESPADFSVGSADRDLVSDTLKKSEEALLSGKHQFFRAMLGSGEAWRAWPEFRDSCVYLDIETDGGFQGEAVTTIGLYDGREFQCLVRGRDLENFPDVISHYSMIVSFYGSAFDLPMLEKRFHGLRFDQIHLDLCFAMKKLGVKGGLKKIEKQLGIHRDADTDGLDGRDAIRLWREFQGGNERSLKRLIAYNRDDVVNLETLAEIAYNRLWASLWSELPCNSSDTARNASAARSTPESSTS